MEPKLVAHAREKWHDMRCTLSPAFSSSKMKMMFHLVCECAKGFVDHFQPDGQEIIPFEANDAFTRLANDMIASVSFGIKCNSARDRENEFFLTARDTFDFSGIKCLIFLGCVVSPAITKFLNITFVNKRAVSFLRRIIRETITLREKGELVRHDMIHLLLKAQKMQLKFDDDDDDADSGFASVRELISESNNARKKCEITDEDILSQCALFFVAGFHTVSITLCTISYHLAVNKDIQQKLIREIDNTIHECKGQITYKALLGMKYLDMVVSEALRMWPAAAYVERKCVKPYKIKRQHPHEEPLEINVGDEIVIPIYALHKDPKYFSMPDKFDPERFNDQNKHSISPYVYLPFGTGPRHCLGNRFALMEIKVAMFYLLSRYEILAIEKTVAPTIAKSSFMLINSNKKYWLGLKIRNK